MINMGNVVGIILFLYSAILLSAAMYKLVMSLLPNISGQSSGSNGIGNLSTIEHGLKALLI